jgi:predicted dehydrogenase
MNPISTRRSFIKRAALAAGALTTTRYLGFPGILSAREPGDLLNCVLIGCGGRAQTHLEQVIQNQKQRLVAMVDPDDSKIAGKKKWLQTTAGLNTDPIQEFSDYRVLFDKIGNQFDTVFIATPNHHHFAAALLALQAGKNVYCEKPLCHDISQTRALARASLKYNKAATQMGNQGHCEEGYRRLCEFIAAGVIGNVTETHSWTDRANGGQGPRPDVLPVPAGLHWDTWIGPAPYRDFHSDLHPHEWHGWHDFGNGSIGNMGCHVLEGVFWALQAGHPSSVEMEFVRGGGDQRYPLGSRVRWDIPARGTLPPFKAYWYEGLNPTTTASPQGSLHAAVGSARSFPPLLAELKQRYPEEELDRGDCGTLYVGDKGVMFTGTYGGNMHVLPLDKMKDIPQPPKPLARPNANPFIDFVETCRAGRTDTATPIEYGARLTEFTLLGNLAQHAGQGRKVEWDGPNMKVTNLPELNQWLSQPPRPGWPA